MAEVMACLHGDGNAARSDARSPECLAASAAACIVPLEVACRASTPLVPTPLGGSGCKIRTPVSGFGVWRLGRGKKVECQDRKGDV
ncbi:hypothetical protein E2C01_057249 [Portunus trituberculatus]|uniref:Uncharacterized protein n=1 Tax=Portunus trituberculatus TaxID=210409 RepID=A0A5B7H0J6_PORTR|nr:hypothetical protein [Portunus trituberculatus]